LGDSILDQRRLSGVIAAGFVVLFMTVALLLPAVLLKAEPVDVSDPDMTVTGEVSGSRAGKSVALLDINGDGAADLVVGASSDSEAGPNAGKVLIYLGNPDDPEALDSEPDIVILGSPNDRFGWAVACAGHVNGDTIDDLIIGAPLNDTGGAYAGMACIFFGYTDIGSVPVDLDSSYANVTLTGSAGGRFGFSVSTAGDLNQDSYDDVVIGEPYSLDNRGQVHIYYGGDSMDENVDKTFAGATEDDWFGWSVAGGVNLDGTLQKDIVVGAPLVGQERGSVQVILNPAKSAPKIITISDVGSSGDRFGSAVALLDINDDQYGDVAVGAPAPGDSAEVGAVYVFYGSSLVSKFDKVADLELSVGAGGDEFGTSLAAGDPWTDSKGDLVVGAPFNDEGGTDAGRAYVFFGNASIEDYQEPDIIAQGDEVASMFGISVASGFLSTADFNNDTAADFAVGASTDGACGAAYLYLGTVAPVLDNPTLWGYVKDVDGDPLDGALVLVESLTVSETYSTEADGSYGVVEEISVPPGDYDITASYDDYFSETVSQTTVLGNDYQIDDFTLDRYPVVSGVIFDGLSPSDPLEDALVQALDDADAVLEELTTGPLGEYEFVLDYEGTLTIKVSKQDYFDEYSDEIPVLRNEEHLDEDMTLDHKPILLVTVTDSGSTPPGDPIEDADVVVTIADVVVASGTTDSDGEVSLIVDGVGLATVTVSKIGYIEDSDDITLAENDDVEMTPPFSLERQPVITGLVQDGDFMTPISGASVELIDSDTDEVLETVETGSNGMYSFGSVEEGTYDVSAWATGYVRMTHWDVVVVPNDPNVCDFDLYRDSIPPESSVTGLSPVPDPVTNIVSELDLVISADATDDKSDIWAVVLWWRFGETGQFDYLNVLDYEAPYEFEFNAVKGDGVYSFYTIAYDWAMNEEAPPADGANDTWVRVVSGIPVSFVEEIEPYEQSTTTFTVTVDSDHAFDIVSVELWYSYNGGDYVKCDEEGDGVPYSWEFEASDGDGVYSFYSIVEDEWGQIEPEPDDPDTSALVDTTAPEISIVAPTEGDLLDSSEVDLRASASDAGAGLALVGYRVDSGDDVIIELDGESSYTLEEALTLEDGTHTVTVWTLDVLGWESGEEQATFDVDTSKPELIITYPEDGDAIPTGDVEVTWTVNEEIDITKVRLDGGSWDVVTGTSFLIPETLDDGEYTISVNVTDMAGFQSQVSSTFVVDTELPTVLIDEPGFLATSTVVIYWNQEDLVSGLESVQIKLDDGDWYDADTEVEDNEYTFYSVSAGMHTVTVTVIDRAGNEATDDATFEVDGTSPAITVVSPDDGGVYGVDSVEFEWSIDDDGTGVESADYKLDSWPWKTLPDNAGSMTLSGLSDGTHTLTVWAIDMAGNEGQVVVQFKVDTEVPTVLISSPTEDEVVATADVEIVYTADGTGSDIASAEMRVDGGSWETAGASPISLGSLDDGDYTVELRVTDEAGYEATAIVNFSVDATALHVDITDPEDGALFDTDTVSVTWTVSDIGATVEAKLDDGAWQPTTGDTMTFTDLADGEHTVTVMATDDDLNEGFDSVTFTVDTTPPTVSISSPEDDAVIGSSSLVVTWTSTDADATERSVDGGVWQVVTGTSVTISSLTDGEHTISIRVTDIAGNEATDSVTVLVDTTAPSVEITAPVDGATVGTEVTVEWTADDGSGSGVEPAEVRIDEGTWTVASGSSHTFTGLTSGEHTVDVRVMDGAGNEGTDSVTFTVISDTTPPTVSITSPTNGSSLASSSVTVTWAASDGTGSGIDTIEVKLDSGAWTAATGTSRAFLALAEGSHTVSVRVTDNAGNAATASVTFMVDTVDPTLTITSPEVGSETEETSVTVTWTCTDTGCGIDRIEVCIDGGSYVSVGTASQRTFSDLAVGDHTVDVRAYDRAGNMVEASIDFTVTEGGGGISALAIAGIVILIVVILAVAVILMRRKKTPSPPAE
jgi:hypothetical protein